MQTCTDLLPLMAATIDAGDSCDNRSCSALHLQESAPTDACDHCEPVTIGEDEYDATEVEFRLADIAHMPLQ